MTARRLITVNTEVIGVCWLVAVESVTVGFLVLESLNLSIVSLPYLTL